MSKEPLTKSLSIEELAEALQEHTERKLSLRGNERVMLTDENLIDVLRSGFVSRDEMHNRLTAALGFVQTCGMRPRFETIQIESDENEEEHSETVAQAEKSTGFLIRFIRMGR